MRVLLIGITVACVSAFAVASIASAHPSRAATTCPKVRGPKWSVGALSGSKYAIVVVGSKFTCKNATPWVKRFIALKMPSTAFSQKLKGPVGYRCATNPDKNRRAVSGNCAKSLSDAFSWSIAPGS